MTDVRGQLQHPFQAAAKTASVIWAARVQNVPIQIAALTEADDYDQGWQSRSGQPDTLLSTASTLIGFSPVPNTGPYSVTLDLVRNAPVPTALGDFLQVGDEVLENLLDYAEHTALTKEGFPSVQDSMPLLNRFMRAAGVQVGVDTASTPNLSALSGQSYQDEIHTPRMASKG